jgi:hypothetical protein
VIQLRYQLNYRGVGDQFLAGAREFSPLHNIQTDSGAHPASYPMVLEIPSPEANRLERDTDNSPLLVTIQNNVWIYGSTSLYVITVWCFIKQGTDLPQLLLPEIINY